MKASAVVLCVATICSLEPLQVIAPKEQPSQWRVGQHQSGNAGNGQYQNRSHTPLEPLQVVATKGRARRNQLKPYMLPVTERAQTSASHQQPPFAWAGGAAASQQPFMSNQFYNFASEYRLPPQTLEQGYYYPSGYYAQQGAPGMALTYPQHSQYQVAANMMPGPSTYYSLPTGILPLPLPTSEQNGAVQQDQTLNKALLTALTMSIGRSNTMPQWLERKVEEGPCSQLRCKSQYQKKMCFEYENNVAFVLSVHYLRRGTQYTRIWSCVAGNYFPIVDPAIEKRDSTKGDAKLVFDGVEYVYTVVALYENCDYTGKYLHAALRGENVAPKKTVGVTLYEL